jgi:hypothetical protein
MRIWRKQWLGFGLTGLKPTALGLPQLDAPNSTADPGVHRTHSPMARGRLGRRQQNRAEDRQRPLKSAEVLRLLDSVSTVPHPAEGVAQLVEQRTFNP